MPKTKLLDTARDIIKTIPGWTEASAEVMADNEVLFWLNLDLREGPYAGRIGSALAVHRDHEGQIFVYSHVPNVHLRDMAGRNLKAAIGAAGWVHEPNTTVEDDNAYCYTLEVTGTELETAIRKALGQAKKLNRVDLLLQGTSVSAVNILGD